MENISSEHPEFGRNKNQSFAATPGILKFFYKDNVKEEKELILTNVSDSSRRLCILPPVTKYFKIKYSKKMSDRAWIAPGLSFSVKLAFEQNTTERVRHYKDYLRVICDMGENELKKDMVFNTSTVLFEESVLQIPLLALPHSLNCNLPDEIFLGHVQLGQSKGYSQTNINQNITDDSHILKHEVEKCDDKMHQNSDESLNILSPTTKKKQTPKTQDIPLNTIFGVSKFLSKKSTQERNPYFDLIGPLGMYQEDEKAIVSKLEKQFITKVSTEKKRLRGLFYRNEIVVGPSPNNPQIEKLAEVIVDRIIAKKNYEDLQIIEKPEVFLSRTRQLQLRRRVVRNADEVLQPGFTSKPENMWFFRYQILSKFVQSVRKVIILNRLIRRLNLLKEALSKEDTPENPTEEKPK